MIARNATLLVIDVQVGIDDPRHGARSTPEAEANIARLLTAWRRAGWPVVHVQHLSVEPGSALRPERPGVAIKPEAAPLPGEPVLHKHANAAFVGTDLEARLRRSGASALVVVGLTADHCVSSTARLAADLGFAVTVVADATAAFEKTAPDGRRLAAEDVLAVSLATLDGEFATLVTTAEALRAASATG